MKNPSPLSFVRTAVTSQAILDLDSPDSSEDNSENSSEEINSGAYIYRAIATNRKGRSDCQNCPLTNMAACRGQREPHQGTEAGFWRRHPAAYRCD